MIILTEEIKYDNVFPHCELIDSNHGFILNICSIFFIRELVLLNFGLSNHVQIIFFFLNVFFYEFSPKVEVPSKCSGGFNHWQNYKYCPRATAHVSPHQGQPCFSKNKSCSSQMDLFLLMRLLLFCLLFLEYVWFSVKSNSLLYLITCL